MFYLKLLAGEYWRSCLAAVAAFISKANLYILFFEVAAIAAYGRLEVAPFGAYGRVWMGGRSCCMVAAIVSIASHFPLHTSH
jgi:hypothetical protein